MNSYFKQIIAFLSRLSIQQKATLGSVLAGGVLLFSMVALWANQPDYSLLFGGLPPSEANRVVESLRERSVKYELRDSGTAVFVPRDQVFELRLSFAGQGVVSEGPAGYELFDTGTLGMTDFMQRLNMKRALEGELSRTISSLRQVATSRVLLVVPERSAFRETQSNPSASVVLQMAGSSRLAEAQIQGITALVAGAVEGMAPGSVTVLDTRGNVLSQPEQGDGNSVMTATQLDMQRSVEDRLVEKGQSMLDQFLGRNNAIVRISAALDFSRSTAESATIDPESATVIAEEKLDERAGESNGAQSSIRNFEVSRTVERSEKAIGAIQYLTISVILNKRVSPTDDPEAPPVTIPYSGEELTEIESLVRNSVGFSPDRGDRITVHQTEFDATEDVALLEEFAAQRDDERLQMLLRYGLIVLALLLAFFMLRSAVRRASQMAASAPSPGSYPAGSPALTAGNVVTAGSLAQAGPQGALQLAAASSGGAAPANPAQAGSDLYSSKLSDQAKAEVQSQASRYEDIVHMATNSPDLTAEIVRSWLEQDTVEA